MTHSLTSRRVHLLAGVLCVVVMLPVALHGQGAAVIQGSITDFENNAVLDATVAAKNDASGAVKSAHSDANGAYQLTGLAPGNYSLTASATGFATNTKSGIVLAEGQTLKITLSLAISTVVQQIEVNAGIDSIAAETAPSGGFLEERSAQSLARETRIPPAPSDVLGSEFDANAAVERLLACGEMELGDALLSQTVLAGVGNVFKSEICFETGLNPFRKVATLTSEQLTKVVSAAQRQLGSNVLEDSDDRIVTYFWSRRRTTHRSAPGESLWVYGRSGEPCRRCGEPIQRRQQGSHARPTYWCPRCQPMPNGDVR